MLTNLRSTPSFSAAVFALALVPWGLSGLMLGACGSSRGATHGDPDGDGGDGGSAEARKGGVIVVANPTPDSWDLSVGGAPRGSVAPGSEARLLSLAPGRQRLVATNTRLGLTQDKTVEVVIGAPASVVLVAQKSRLRVHNPHADAVEIALDGDPIGTAAPGTETTFDGLHAGRRMLMFKSTRGPGSMRLEHTLPPDGTSVLTVPDVSAQIIDPTAPRAPDGQGLVRLKNASRLLVHVFAGGRDLGPVPAGARFDIVLPPGTHTLEVRIEGIEARTEHTVTLMPNQVAEWVWGEQASP